MARLALIALLTCAAPIVSAADTPAPLRLGALCVGSGDRVTSSECLVERRPANSAFLMRSVGVTTAGHLQNAEVPAPESLLELTFSINGEGKRWPVATTLELDNAKTTWRWGLAPTDARKKQNVRVAPGVYRLTFIAPGHQRFERDVKVADARVDLGTITLAASRTVSGIVVSPERRTVAGCAVLADGVALGFSDARGRFDAELPVPVPRSVTLAHPQFAPRVEPILQAGDTPLGTVQLSRGGSIACTIDRQALGEDVKISADLFHFVAGDSFRRRDSALLNAGETTLNFSNLDPGDYGILLKGGAPLDQMIVPVTVGDGAVSEVLVAITPWRLHLTARYGDEPLGDATVHLLNSGVLERRVWNPEIRLDANGAADVDIWQRGRISGEVRSERLQSGFSPPSFTVSTNDDHADWDIVVPRRRVHGVVLDDATGEPIAGVRVFQESEFVSGPAKNTDAEGRFSVDVFHEGTHTFRVDSKNYLPSERVAVTFVEPSGERRIEFRLKKGKTILLEVRDGDGRAAASAVVIDGCAPGLPRRGFRTDAGGSLALPSQGGPHRLCVLPIEGSFALADADAPKEVSPAPMQIRVPPPQVTMRISAKTTDGLPVAQLGVLLVHNGRVVPPVVVQTIAELQRRFSRTDHRGELILAGMPAGHYELFAYATDEEADSLAADRRRTTPVYSGYLAPGEAALEITIEARN